MCYGQKMKYCIMDYTNEDIEFAIRLLNRREEVPEEEAQEWLAEPGHEELVDELALIRKVLSAQKGHEAQPAEMPRLQRRGTGGSFAAGLQVGAQRRLPLPSLPSLAGICSGREASRRRRRRLPGSWWS